MTSGLEAGKCAAYIRTMNLSTVSMSGKLFETFVQMMHNELVAVGVIFLCHFDLYTLCSFTIKVYRV